VSFELATIPDIPIEGPFDAVVGRLILMHVPQPAAVLRQLAKLVRPGGLIVFQEFDISMGRSAPELPQFTMLVDLIVRSIRGVGLSTEFGTSLYGIFQEAGLPTPSMVLGAAMGGAANFDDGFKYLVDVWRMLLPLADQLGLVTDEVSDPDALLARLRDEATSNNAVITGPSLVSAWTTVTTEGR
jgi:SAM-dependent methyltransferase